MEIAGIFAVIVIIAAVVNIVRSAIRGSSGRPSLGDDSWMHMNHHQHQRHDLTHHHNHVHHDNSHNSHHDGGGCGGGCD